MAVDTFMAYVGVYDSIEDANSDYDLVKELHSKVGLIDARRRGHRAAEDGKVKITRKHETPARVGGVLGGGVDWPPAWWSPLFPSPPSAAACSPPRPPVAPSSVQSAAAPA